MSPSGFTNILHLNLLATTHSQQQIHYKSVFAFTQDQNCDHSEPSPSTNDHAFGALQQRLSMRRHSESF
jgi:hypothetical protein